MKQSKILLACAVAFTTSAFVAPHALSNWDTYGVGVVFFNGSSKVIYKDQVRSVEQVFATDRNSYNAAQAANDDWEARGVDAINFVPSNRRIKRDYDTYGANDPLEHTFLYELHGAGTVREQVGRSSSGIACAPGQNCGSVSVSIGKDQCTSHEISLGGSVGIGLGDLFKKLVKPVEFLDAFTGDLGYSKGWQSCTSRSESHSCPGESGLGFATETFATRELKTKFGDSELTPKNGNVYDTGYNDSDFQQVCQDIGGTYEYRRGWPLYSANLCKNVKNKVKWTESGRWALNNAPTELQCRVIKAR